MSWYYYYEMLLIVGVVWYYKSCCEWFVVGLTQKLAITIKLHQYK